MWVAFRYAFGSLARVPLVELSGRYWYLVEMSSRWWVPLLVLLLGDLRIAGADKSIQAEDATLPVWTLQDHAVSADLNRFRRQSISSMSFRHGL